MTLILLWEEYRTGQPDGYGYSRFCDLARHWRGRLSPTMRQTHPAGEQMFVDYAGQTAEVVDNATGEVRRTALITTVRPSARLMPNAPRLPQRGTKWAVVSVLLRRPEGASVTPVAETTGWAQHTVDSFFACLNKSDIAVGVLERDRRAKPGKAGAKERFTSYYIEEVDRCAHGLRARVAPAIAPAAALCTICSILPTIAYIGQRLNGPN